MATYYGGPVLMGISDHNDGAGAPQYTVPAGRYAMVYVWEGTVTATNGGTSYNLPSGGCPVLSGESVSATGTAAFSVLEFMNP